MATATDDQAAAAQAAADKAAADKAAADAQAAADAKKVADADKTLEKFPEEIREHIRELRAESRKRLDKIRELETSATTAAERLEAFEKAEAERKRAKLEEESKFKEIADAEKARADKIEADSKEALRKKDVAIIRAALRSLGEKAGIIDPEDLKTIDVRELRVDDDGQVPGAKEAVEALAEKKPHWFKTAGSGGTNGNGNGRATTTTPTGGTNGAGADASTWDSATMKQRWNTIPKR